MHILDYRNWEYLKLMILSLNKQGWVISSQIKETKKPGVYQDYTIMSQVIN